MVDMVAAITGAAAIHCRQVIEAEVIMAAIAVVVCLQDREYRQEEAEVSMLDAEVNHAALVVEK